VKLLTTSEILALLSAASVLRKEKHLIELLIYCKAKKIKRIKIYESLLQTYLFAGFPSALVSLKKFNDIIPLKNPSQRDSTRLSSFEKGKIICRKIYGNKFDKLISNIYEFSPELSEWLIKEGYGKVISRTGLSIQERELSIISILSCLKYKSQLYSHINGAYRNKVNKQRIKKVIQNLEQLGNKSYTKFGLRVYDDFFKKQNVSN